MILIAHRGNFNGPNKYRENTISYIEEAIYKGYDAEIDVRAKKNKIYIGHDQPIDLVTDSWLKKFKNKLWIHCKDPASFDYFNNLKQYNYFWHEDDAFTITSKGFVLSHVKNSINKLSGKFIKIQLEKKKINGNFVGILSDYPVLYK